MEESIESHDASFDELSDATLNSIRVSPTSCDSTARRPSDSAKYDPSSIKMLLKEQPEKFALVDNRKMNPAKPSPCWKRFAFPAVKDENDRSVIIRNLASCRSCFTTYTYEYGSTKSLNETLLAPH